MFIRKLASVGAVAAFALAGPALANQEMGGATQDQHGATQYDSTDKQAANQQGQQDLQVKVKEVDRSNNKVTFEADLSSQASIQGENQQQIELSELSEGDEVRASFDPVTGDITRLEVVSKGSEGGQQQQQPSTPEQEPSQPDMGSY